MIAYCFESLKLCVSCKYKCKSLEVTNYSSKWTCPIEMSNPIQCW